MFKSVFFLVSFYLINSLAIGQVNNVPADRLNYWRDIPAMLNEQNKLLSKEINEVLRRYPPTQMLPGTERKLALFSIDAMLHDTRLDTSASVNHFIEYRHQMVLDALKKPIKKNQVQVLKLYNHGFIIRSKSATIAFDMIFPKTANRRLVSDSLMEALTAFCDALFVSHVHSDHADRKVADLFIKKEKNVYTPPMIWENISPRIISLRSYNSKDTIISLRGKNLMIRAYAGHQDEVLNNLYAVTMPENITIMHTGDQYNQADLSWIRELHKSKKVDLLLLHNWVNHLDAFLDGIRPGLVISSHENEMAHSIDHREPYWLALRRLSQIDQPVVAMFWGEEFLLNSRQNKSN